MSIHIAGFREADEKWNKMKAAWDTCKAAGVEIPDAVLVFFDDEYPGDKPGAEVKLGEAAKEWRDEYYNGYEVDITKLPKDVTVIRFYNSY